MFVHAYQSERYHNLSVKAHFRRHLRNKYVEMSHVLSSYSNVKCLAFWGFFFLFVLVLVLALI